MSELHEYCPIQSLREEVTRFKATNKFTPFEVTSFYCQAAVVLHILDDLAMLVKRLARENVSENAKAEALFFLKRQNLEGSVLRQVEKP